MPIKTPDYQLRLNLNLPDDQQPQGIGALSVDDIRIRAEAARAKLENGESWKRSTLGKVVPPAWYQEYLQLLAGGWDWRVAVYIAWKATPKKYRWPESQEELATEVLGLSSDRVISAWRAKNPAIDAMVQDVGSARVLDRLSDSIEAMLEVAAMPNYKGRGDRELHFKLAGVLSEQIDINDKSGLPDLTKLSWEDKVKLAGLDTPDKMVAFIASMDSVAQEEKGVPLPPLPQKIAAEERGDLGGSSEEAGE